MSIEEVSLLLTFIAGMGCLLLVILYFLMCYVIPNIRGWAKCAVRSMIGLVTKKIRSIGCVIVCLDPGGEYDD